MSRLSERQDPMAWRLRPWVVAGLIVLGMSWLPAPARGAPGVRLQQPGNGQFSELSSLAFSPDGRRLAAGGEIKYRGVLKLWDVASGRLLKALEADDRDTVHALAFSRDGKWLASAQGNDGATLK